MARHVIYPGSFDPVTLGHVDILKRVSLLFDQTTVVVAEVGKAGLLPVAKRVQLIEMATANLANVSVAPFSGLLVDEVKRLGATAVVRGIRSAGDYEHEWSLAGVNAILAGGIEYVYLLAKPELAAVSSSLVRDVMSHGGDLRRLVPASVAEAIDRWSS